MAQGCHAEQLCRASPVYGLAVATETPPDISIASIRRDQEVSGLTGPKTRGRSTRLATALLALATAAVAGCAVATVTEGPPPSRGLDCVDDSPRCVHERRLALDALMADRQRTWIRQPASAAGYASGVRLFAYKQRRRELTCDELRLGEREAADAAQVLRGPAGRGLSTGQIARGAMLGDEVARDLKRESARRCRR